MVEQNPPGIETIFTAPTLFFVVALGKVQQSPVAFCNTNIKGLIVPRAVFEKLTEEQGVEVLKEGEERKATRGHLGCRRPTRGRSRTAGPRREGSCPRQFKKQYLVAVTNARRRKGILKEEETLMTSYVPREGTEG
eukprot:TRINITY_DN11241_c0_g1_i1.p1 TRINITY_DN11241_c0_g1~~TRINITY_DN11241_c0_g1_i1.p1  ORF type:complete len:136 (-),score=7.12 TRINITY_DN11241_c0_g1_i1:285-692(-)